MKAEPKNIRIKSQNEIISSKDKKNGFHEKYLKICKWKNIATVPEVKKRNQKNFQELDFHADRIRPIEWIAITEALRHDKSLKFIAIRLRKNTGKLYEDVDTMKKVLAFTAWPVVYTKLIFTELMEAIEQVIKNSVVETLILEGLPIKDSYVLMLTKGLTENSGSLKHLSFQRCNLGDTTAIEICQTVSSMMNLETLDLSGCELSIKGAEAIANVIKMQKMCRYSNAWVDSLRYREVEPDDFTGLRCVNIKNNPHIGDEGVKLITEELCDDEWMKEIDMENCGIGDDGAECIVKCLNVNKKISTFSIAQNFNVSEKYHKHIVLHLASSTDSSDSSKSLDSLVSDIPNVVVVTKAELLEKVKMLIYRYEVELTRRKRAEELAEKLSLTLKEMERTLMAQEALKIPKGFTLVDNDTIHRLLKEQLILVTPARSKKPYQLKKMNHPRKVVSSKSLRPASIKKPTRSESRVTKLPIEICFEEKVGDGNSRPGTVKTIVNDDDDATEVVTFPQNIGDSNETRPSTVNTLVNENEDVKHVNELGDIETQDPRNLFRKSFKDVFIATVDKEKSPSPQHDDLITYDPRNLFKKSANLVPWNSDAESDE